MISNISEYISKWLVSKGSITQEDEDLYTYGFFILFSNLLYLIIVLFIGLMLKCPFESIVFFIAFRFVRKYAGGYHAATEARCEILSFSSIAICIVLIKLSKQYDLSNILFFAALIAAIIILILCPLDTEEKPLTQKEIRHFRKLSWIFTIVIAAAIIVTYILKVPYILIPLCLSLVTESILLSLGKIQREMQKKNKNKPS